MLSNGISYATTINGGDADDTFMIFHNIAVLQLNGDNGDDTFVVRTFLHRDEETRIKSGTGRDLIQYVSNSPVAIDGGEGFELAPPQKLAELAVWAETTLTY